MRRITIEELPVQHFTREQLHTLPGFNAGLLHGAQLERSMVDNNAPLNGVPYDGLLAADSRVTWVNARGDRLTRGDLDEHERRLAAGHGIARRERGEVATEVTSPKLMPAPTWHERGMARTLRPYVNEQRLRDAAASLTRGTDAPGRR